MARHSVYQVAYPPQAVTDLVTSICRRAVDSAVRCMMSFVSPTASGTPPTTRLRVREDSPHRLLVQFCRPWTYLWFFCLFCLVWNALLLVAVFLRVSDGVRGVKGPWTVEEVSLLLAMGLMGLGGAYFLLRLKFTTTCLRVEPNYLAVTAKFLVGTSSQETTLCSDSTVDILPKTFVINDGPVLAINVHGVDRTVQFGALLSEQDQQCLVARIKAVTGLKSFTDDVGHHADPVVTPPRLPLRSRLQIVEDLPHRLEIHIPTGGPRASWLGLFSLVWILMISYPTVALSFVDWNRLEIEIVILLAVMAAAFWSLGLATTVIWGRTRSDMGESAQAVKQRPRNSPTPRKPRHRVSN